MVIEANDNVGNNSVIGIRLTDCFTLEFHSILSLYYTRQGCTNPGRPVAMATKFFKVMPDICGFSVWALFRVIFLAPRILRWLLDFWKICAPLTRGL
jgi:hypothetical protein